jgi:hypothetical protein
MVQVTKKKKKNTKTWLTCLQYTPTHAAAALRGPEHHHRGLQITETLHSVGLWTHDQPVAEICTKHITRTRESAFSPAGFEPSVLTSEQP